MTDTSRADSRAKAMCVLQKLGVTILLGIVAGTIYVMSDIARFGRGLGSGDVIIAVLLAITLSVPLALLLACLMSTILAVTGARLGHRDWLAVMCGLAVMGPAVAASLTLDPEGSGATRPLIAFVSIPLAIMCAALARRRSWGAGRHSGLIWVAVAVSLMLGGMLLWEAMPCVARSEPPKAAPAGTSGPNVVFIVLDTVRRDRFGCYGHEGGLTQMMDRFASESVVYDQAISTAPWTVPSHASMLTGLFPVTHGCSYEHHVWLDDHFVTLQEILGAAGYQTLALCSNFWVEESNILQGFEKTISLEGTYDLLATRRLAYAWGRPARWVDKGCSEGIDALSLWLNHEYDPDRPTFLFVNLFEAHCQYVPPAQTRDQLARRGIEAGPALKTAQNYNPCLTNIEKREDPELARTLSALYDAEIQYQDQRLGDLFDLLRRHIPIENTLMIVTSDHGENLGEAGRWEHLFAINDLLLHVPLVIRYPIGRWAGTRVGGLCQPVDLFSTVLEAAGLKEESTRAAGRSLVPDSFEPRPAAFAQVSPFYPYLHYVEQARGLDAGMGDYVAHHRAIRTERYKYVWSSMGNHALYDLHVDPLETVNLVSREPELADTLHHQLLDWWAGQPVYQPPKVPRSPVPMDNRVIERLRSLGYVR